MMLSLDTAYRSFGGEVEALSTPTICRLPDSRRHQLSAIAQLLLYGVSCKRRVGDDRSLDQSFSVSRTEHNVWAKRGEHLSCGRLHDKKQAIENVAQRMFGGERQLIARIQEHIDCCRQGTTPAVTQHHDELQATAKVLNRVLDASKHLRAQPVARHADDEKIVRSFVENEFDGYTGVGAAQYGGIRPLLRVARHQAQIARIDRYDLLYAFLVLDVVEKRGEIPIASFQAEQSRIGV